MKKEAAERRSFLLEQFKIVFQGVQIGIFLGHYQDIFRTQFRHKTHTFDKSIREIIDIERW